MFGVGIHFSIRDLLMTRTLAVAGAVLQVALPTCLRDFSAPAATRGAQPDRGRRADLDRYQSARLPARPYAEHRTRVRPEEANMLSAQA